MKPTPVRRRSAARLAAVQMSYQGQMSGQSVAEFLPVFLQHYSEDIRKSFRVKDLDSGHLNELAMAVETRRDELDEILAECLAEGWTLDRMTVIDRAVRRRRLRTVHAHLPARAVVSEYAALADVCGCDVGFINAILDRVARDARAASKWDLNQTVSAVDDQRCWRRGVAQLMPHQNCPRVSGSFRQDRRWCCRCFRANFDICNSFVVIKADDDDSASRGALARPAARSPFADVDPAHRSPFEAWHTEYVFKIDEAGRRGRSGRVPSHRLCGHGTRYDFRRLPVSGPEGAPPSSRQSRVLPEMHQTSLWSFV